MPPRSPFSLIQEDLYPNSWLILVSCMMLNRTSRKQVEKILPRFVELWPTPRDFIHADPDVVKQLCKSLGFAETRTKNLFKMTQRFLAGPWEHASELPGVGQYGSRSWEIFCDGVLGDEPPKDHALVQYWEYCKTHGYLNESKKRRTL